MPFTVISTILNLGGIERIALEKLLDTLGLTCPSLNKTAIPFAIMGLIIAFALHGMALGLVAMMGVIGLAGVVVNDSLVLVHHVNGLRKQRPEESVKKLVAERTSDRLRAVILTSLTTVAGLLPLGYGIGGSDPYMAPMALALACGLLFATPITLILVPSLYMVRDDFGRILRVAARMFKSSRRHQEE